MDQNFDLELTEFFFMIGFFLRVISIEYLIIVEKCNLYYRLGHFFFIEHENMTVKGFANLT